jgi:hypothetical protein
MAASNFVFNNPRVERIVSGPGSIEKLSEEIERVGGTRALYRDPHDVVWWGVQ